jgi:hypothetical protein
VTTAISNKELTVAPGGEVSTSIMIRNTGSIVAEYTFAVLGDCAAWAEVTPPRLTLYPGTDGTATVTFRPPRRPEVLAGPVPFGIRVISSEDAEAGSVDEGVLIVEPYYEAFAELVPRTARGRRHANYNLAVDNRGNVRLNAPIVASDPDGLLLFAMSPPTVVADPGTAVFARIRVKPRKRFMKGPPKTMPFQVVAQPEGVPPLIADGALLQEALLPDWIGKAALALVALALVLAVLWLTILKPSIKSTAKGAAKQQLASAQTQATIKAAAAQAGQQAAKQAVAGPGAGAGTAAGSGGTGTGTGTQTPATITVSNGLKGTPVDGRLQSKLTGTGSDIISFTVPAGKTLQLTDIVLENQPNDDKGLVNVQRNGQVLLSVALENFRDLDYHFVAPILFQAGQQLQIASSVTACSATCQPGMYYSGYLE